MPSPGTPRPSPPRFSAAELAQAIASRLGGLSQSAQVGLELGLGQPPLHITRWHYHQRLNEPWTLEIEASAAVAIESPAQLLWQSAVFWQRDGLLDFHRLAGRVQSIAQGGDSADLVHYRFTVVPALTTLQRLRRQRVFQRVNVVEVAQTLLSEAGLYPVELRALPELARWRHLSQHRDAEAPERFETDLHFIRRILALEGLALWLEPDEAGERIVIGQAGIEAGIARSLPLATPAGLHAAMPEQLRDVQVMREQTPDIASVWATNYRDQGRALRAHAFINTDAAEPRRYEIAAPEADALQFEGNAASGVQSWLDRQAQLQAQRFKQQRLHLQASSNAAGLWRCGQTVQLDLNALDVNLDSLWLLTEIEAGSHVGAELGSEEPPSGPHVHFRASPFVTWMQDGWIPRRLETAPLTLEQARISASAGSPYAYLDPQGRYQVRLRSDEADSADGAVSRPVRHIRSHAGPDHGWHLPLHGDTEVLLAYHLGHPDTPMIARALHTSRQPDHVAAINATRNVLRTWANNKFRLEDRQGQEHIKLSTEYGLSQLNLGHQVDAQGRPRGEGFELRTDQWGAVRAGQGLLISTFAGQPRGASGNEQTPAHQRYNPGAADAQGAQALSGQRSAANEQVGLGQLEALAATRRLVEAASGLSAPLVHAASSENLLLLTPASQVIAANTLSLAAQGRLELSSAEQIRLYAKEGISWHTEGVDPAAGGQGCSRTDVISHGSDELQVLNGSVQLLAEQDIVLEFAGARGLLAAKGATLELTQAGTLTITANQEIVSEASSHKIGGALDWGNGSGSAAAGPLGWWGKMEVKDVCVECLLKAQRSASPLASMGE